MMSKTMLALMIGAATLAAVPAAAQETVAVARPIAGTRLDVSATGSVSRVPDLAITSSINLNPDYRYENNQSPVLTGYQASNNVSIRFRDIRNAGQILDALVAEGANQINGPSLTIDKPEAAYDEARTKALAVGRARADLYARSLGMRVTRLLSVSESGGFNRPPMPMVMMAQAERSSDAKTGIDPGSQDLEVSLAMSFELQ
jgi:uncharacterized protein YggE